MTTEQPLNVAAVVQTFELAADCVAAVVDLIGVMNAEELVLARIEAVTAIRDLTERDAWGTIRLLERVVHGIDTELARRERPDTVVH